ARDGKERLRPGLGPSDAGDVAPGAVREVEHHPPRGSPEVAPPSPSRRGLRRSLAELSGDQRGELLLAEEVALHCETLARKRSSDPEVEIGGFVPKSIMPMKPPP